VRNAHCAETGRLQVASSYRTTDGEDQIGHLAVAATDATAKKAVATRTGTFRGVVTLRITGRHQGGG
jgi:hypothetical protein